jgi:hypothetical protein
MIDFQMMSPGHPAKDIWYFLYSCTDSNWRKEHLDECLRVYFDEYNPYLTKAGINMEYEAFYKEVHIRRGIGLIFGLMLLPIVLNPEPMDAFRTATDFKKFGKWREETFSEPPKEDDHEMINEIKRRFIDMAEEWYALRWIDRVRVC